MLQQDPAPSEPARQAPWPNVSADDARGKPFGTYPGSKDAAGSAERLISWMPPHSVYVEPFLGNGATLRRKVPALHTIGIDLDREVIDRWAALRWPGLELAHADAFDWLEAHGPSLPPDALVYADPPYPHATRTHRQLYQCELTDQEHDRLLNLIDSLPCSVMISSYPNEQYRRRLRRWTCRTFRAQTRGGPRIEAVWFNRHACSIAGFNGTARFTGRDYRDRERIKRKAARWLANFERMPQAERDAVLSALLRVPRQLPPSAPPRTAARRP